LGIPIGWTTDGANRNDGVLLPRTREHVARRGPLEEIETLHLDRGYDNSIVPRDILSAGIDDLVCAKKRPKGEAKLEKQPLPLGRRWPIERTNSWTSNFAQLRRSTDRFVNQRLAALALAITLIITVKLLKCKDRW
jgi:hypothetical protein